MYEAQGLKRKATAFTVLLTGKVAFLSAGFGGLGVVGGGEGDPI